MRQTQYMGNIKIRRQHMEKSKRVLVPLSDGFDEIEAFTTISLLRRAKIEVRVAGVPGVILTGSDGTKIITDGRFDDIDSSGFDALLLVGGNVHERLANYSRFMDTLKRYDQAGKTIAAIGEAPLLLAKAGMLNNRRATILQGMERSLPKPRDEKVIVDGHIITAQSPTCAMDFGLKLVEMLASPSRASYLREALASGTRI